jgi:hypothetical protein
MLTIWMPSASSPWLRRACASAANTACAPPRALSAAASGSARSPLAYGARTRDRATGSSGHDSTASASAAAYRRILARVESRQMEAERADAPEQAPHREPARMHAGVLAQAATDAFDVFGQFRGIGITLGGVVRARREPRADEVQQVAVRHVGVARTDLRRGLRQQRAVRVEAFEHRRGYAHAVERLREQPRELRAFGAVALDDDVPLPAQRRRDGRGVRVRIAVHVAAGPVGEAQQPRQGRAGAVDVDDGAFERFVERRHDAVDRVGEVEVDMFELVEHARSLAGDVGGLPGAGQRHAQARPIDLALGRGARADQIGDQRTHDLLLLLEQDAPRHFGRMRGEHGFDVDARQRGEQDVRADAGLAQAQQNVVQAVGLRRCTGDLVIAPAPDALHALGDVDHLEIGGERARDGFRGGRVQAVELARQCVERGGLAAPRDGCRARRLDAGVEGFAILLDEQFADEAAEPAHVLAQGGIGGFEVGITGGAHARLGSKTSSLAAAAAPAGLVRRVAQAPVFLRRSR